MPSKLLLVEDDEANLETAASFLQRRNYQVVARPGVAGAMRALESDPEIGLVVTDLRMPGLDGFAIIRGAGDLAQKTGRTVPVIVLTGHGTPEDEQQAKSFGVAHFQRKPIDLIQLRQAIEMCRDAAGTYASARPARVEPANE